MVVVVALAILAVRTAHAEQCPLIPGGTASWDGNQASELLRDGQFSQVEATLEKQHQKNLASEGEDLLTLRNVTELLQLSDQEENLVRMWADQRPQSFFAQFSAGVFYANRASDARGQHFISQTSSSQLTDMRKLDKTATAYLQKAMQLDPRSALPQGILLNIAAMEGQAAGKSAEQWLQAANQVDPKNLAARIQAANHLSPRWGGSFELLDQMVQQAEKSLPAQSAYYLRYNVVLAKASHEEVITGNKSQAQALYKSAKSMCENSSVARDGIIRTYQ